jgi:dipeptidyl aminopeptidase/acylaminoacyl peptidase
VRLARPLIAVALLLLTPAVFAAGFTIPQILSAPFASDIVASREARAFAWVSDARGARNVWLAVAASAGGAFEAHPLTHYTADDGLEIAEIAFVPHHDALLYVRGGDFEYPDKPAPNPAQLTAGVVQEVWLVDSRGRSAFKLGDGHAPVAAPDGERVLFLREGKVFTVAPRKGAKAEQLFKTRGGVGSLHFSPDGKQLALVCERGDHSFVGVYTFADQTLRWIDASFSYDVEPRWSPDGSRIAFLRIPWTHDEVGIISHRTGFPWSIRVAKLADGSASEIYRAPRAAGSVFHELSSPQQLFWGAGEHLLFPAENDGWLHLYSLPAAGGGPAQLLTPGRFEIEYAAASPDGSRIVYAANAGDISRRHLWQLSTADGHLEQLSRGAGIETQPVVLADGVTIAFLRADARIPAHAAVLAAGKPIADFMAEGLPQDFPAAGLVEPQPVDLPERAGIAAHGVLFVPQGGAAARHPAVVFLHGGPIRQMLPTWHYRHYYSNSYAMNQYLASRGYVVLALNYRAGIGYGLDFREADGVGAAGASEYNDVLASADFLRARADVDPARIGLWGGSYGGYLTALGLARNSELFKAGVDLHGVHDWYHDTLATDRDDLPLYPPDAPPAALATALAASPISALSTWRSPVLLIQGDDDHNVAFSESVRLAEGLREHGVEYQELVLPDEIHGFLRYASWVRAYQATADFLDAKLAVNAPKP